MLHFGLPQRDNIAITACNSDYSEFLLNLSLKLSHEGKTWS